MYEGLLPFLHFFCGFLSAPCLRKVSWLCSSTCCYTLWSISSPIFLLTPLLTPSCRVLISLHSCISHSSEAKGCMPAPIHLFLIHTLSRRGAIKNASTRRSWKVLKGLAERPSIAGQKITDGCDQLVLWSVGGRKVVAIGQRIWEGRLRLISHFWFTGCFSLNQHNSL